METSFDEESAGKLDDRPLQQSPRQQHNFSAGGCEELSEGYHTCCGCGKRVDNDEVPYQTFYVCATTSTSKVVLFKSKVWHDVCYRSSFNNESLRRAVDLWCSNRAAAESHFGHISTWNTSQVTNMSGLFKDKDFNDNIGSWDVSNVDDMSHMFAFNFTFNRDIGKWNVQRVVDMNHMFYYSRSFNQSISKWDVRRVQSMRGMFANTSAFNQPLDGWAVNEACDLNHMFYHAARFKHDLETWRVSRRSIMKTLGMFDGAGDK